MTVKKTTELVAAETKLAVLRKERDELGERQRGLGAYVGRASGPRDLDAQIKLLAARRTVADAEVAKQRAEVKKLREPHLAAVAAAFAEHRGELNQRILKAAHELRAAMTEFDSLAEAVRAAGGSVLAMPPVFILSEIEARARGEA